MGFSVSGLGDGCFQKLDCVLAGVEGEIDPLHFSNPEGSTCLQAWCVPCPQLCYTSSARCHMDIHFLICAVNECGDSFSNSLKLGSLVYT